MDEKAKQEARRRKILDNAEARLRFIKEGIPWRAPAVQNETVSTDNIETKEDSPTKEVEVNASDKGTVSAEIIKTENVEVNSMPDNSVEDRLMGLSEERLFNLNNSKQKMQTTPDVFNNCETSPPEYKVPSEDNLNNKNQSSPLKIMNMDNENKPDVIRHKESSDQVQCKPINSNTRSIPLVQKTIEDILNESLSERREHKQKNLDQDRNFWIGCFGMLCLGFLVRISYAVGLSWIFKEMMLVPFVTAAIPRLISVIQNPPAPNSSWVRVLIMSGVKIKIINRGFIVAFVLRTFLQLFSVYLVSFLLTHQLMQSLFTI